LVDDRLKKLAEKYLQITTVVANKYFVEMMFLHDFWHVIKRNYFLVWR